MYTIHLKDIILYGKHGVYEEEQILDAPFRIDVDCTLKEYINIQKLEHTVNYVAILDTVKELFATSYALLEVLASEIAEKLKYQYPDIVQVSIRIHKLNPLIAGIQGSVGITYTT
jgi:7,8-dihydroneopterin aldolase/epimerase/oxygenase